MRPLVAMMTGLALATAACGDKGNDQEAAGNQPAPGVPSMTKPPAPGAGFTDLPPIETPEEARAQTPPPAEPVR